MKTWLLFLQSHATFIMCSPPVGHSFWNKCHKERGRVRMNLWELSWLRGDSNTKVCWHAPALSNGRVIIYCAQSSTTQPQRIKVVAESRSGSWFVSTCEQWGALIMWGRGGERQGLIQLKGKGVLRLCWVIPGVDPLLWRYHLNY